MEIDNPGKRNAMSLDMWQALGTLLAGPEARYDPTILLTLNGRGGAFCSGADISEFGAVRSTPEQVAAYDRANSRAYDALRAFPGPTIALVEGDCMGGGVGLAAACDVRIASTTARFCLPPAKLGLAYPIAPVADITRLVGPGAARYLFYSARVFDAATALRMGLVDDVIEADRFAEEADAIIARMLELAPLSQAAAKAAVGHALGTTSLEEANRRLEACFRSEDYAEGRDAFAQKRKPRFTGR